jgi:hypothetical protein
MTDYHPTIVEQSADAATTLRRMADAVEQDKMSLLLCCSMEPQGTAELQFYVMSHNGMPESCNADEGRTITTFIKCLVHRLLEKASDKIDPRPLAVLLIYTIIKYLLSICDIPKQTLEDTLQILIDRATQISDQSDEEMLSQFLQNLSLRRGSRSFASATTRYCEKE